MLLFYCGERVSVLPSQQAEAICSLPPPLNAPGTRVFFFRPTNKCGTPSKPPFSGRGGASLFFPPLGFSGWPLLCFSVRRSLKARTLPFSPNGPSLDVFPYRVSFDCLFLFPATRLITRCGCVFPFPLWSPPTSRRRSPFFLVTGCRDQETRLFSL